jgi:hypothetical protein
VAAGAAAAATAAANSSSHHHHHHARFCDRPAACNISFEEQQTLHSFAAATRGSVILFTHQNGGEGAKQTSVSK